MVGFSAPRQEITDLSLAVLQDTGWYEVNYSLSKFLLYGYGPSMGRDLLSALPDGIPRKEFPLHYQCGVKDKMKCSWDRRSIGFCASTPLNCSKSNNSAHCNTSWYRDPDNTGFVSSNPLVSYIFPNTVEGNICLNKEMSSTFSKYETRGPTSFCYEFVPNTEYSPICLDTTCNDNLTLTLTFQGNRKVLCERENDVVSYHTFRIICPDPKEICTMIEFEKISHPDQGFEYPTIHLPSPTAFPRQHLTKDDRQTRLNMSEALTLLCIGICMCFVLHNIFVRISKCCRKTKNHID
jgi:leishmanolysin